MENLENAKKLHLDVVRHENCGELNSCSNWACPRNIGTPSKRKTGQNLFSMVLKLLKEFCSLR